MTISEWAPHKCTGKHEDGDACASPAYIGFGVPPKCTQLGCPHYDKKTADEYAIEMDKLLSKAKTMSIKDIISIKIDGKEIKGMPMSPGFTIQPMKLTLDPYVQGEEEEYGTIAQKVAAYTDPDPLHVEQLDDETDEEYTERVNKIVGNVPEETLKEELGMPINYKLSPQEEALKEKVREAILKVFADAPLLNRKKHVVRPGITMTPEVHEYLRNGTIEEDDDVD